MNSLSLVLGFLAFATSGATAQLKRVEVPIGPRGSDITLQLFQFDSRNITLKIIDLGGLTREADRDLSRSMVAHGCIAGCNGGPFTRDGTPGGLVIADGQSSGTKNTSAPLAAGVLFLDGIIPRIQRAAPYFQNAPATTPRQLLQSGPFLVENGKAAPGLSPRRFSRRSFILTDGKSLWAIGYSPPVTLEQLAKALANPKTFKSFNVATALSLGNGSSTALWIKQTHHPFYLKELDPARNAIGLIRK